MTDNHVYHVSFSLQFVGFVCDTLFLRVSEKRRN